MRNLPRTAVWFFLTTLGSACDRHADRPPTDTAVRQPVVVAQQAAPEPDSLSSSNETPAVRLRRFGLVHLDTADVPCLTIDADSLPPGTDIQLVLLDRAESSRSTQRLGKAVTVGVRRERCADSTSVPEGESAYQLRFLTGEPQHAIAIVGPVDTLRLEQNHALAVFPGDTAHWKFWTCSSMEGLHDQVGRQSADSLIVIWDAYTYLGYDMVGTCPGDRDLAIANEVRSRIARWQSGSRDRDTAMRLLMARWTRCDWDDEAGADSANTGPDSAAVFPPMNDMLHALGAPDELTPEEAFVVGTLAKKNDACFDESIRTWAGRLRADAARREPSSVLFTFLAASPRPRRGPVNAAAAEIHRRFDHRGEFYRMLVDWLRSELTSG